MFVKNNLSGSLQLVTIDTTINKNGKIYWTTKQVLMLIDENGRQLTSHQFRSNATKQAEKILVADGWSIKE